MHEGVRQRFAAGFVGAGILIGSAVHGRFRRCMADETGRHVSGERYLSARGA